MRTPEALWLTRQSVCSARPPRSPVMSVSASPHAARAHLTLLSLSWLLLLLHVTPAEPEIFDDAGLKIYLQKERINRAIAASSESTRSCLYEGRWHANGAAVTSRAACLKCACVSGALACSRRACALLPDPPPRRCHVLHRRGACCPELHCPNGVVLMEHGASARFENEDHPDVTSAVSFAHACVEGGTVYSAGSAMESSVACEQCFCLHGARRCVRPRCLPPPAGCQARPAPGACCPQRYYCDHDGSTKPPEHRPHDCKVEGTWIQEGERVPRAEAIVNCTQCFCLRGAVRCQPLACAPPLLGCKPLLRPGQCCAHQYQCEHKQTQEAANFNKELETANLLLIHNALNSLNHEDRSFHSPRRTSEETTTNNEIRQEETTDDNATLVTTTSHSNSHKTEGTTTRSSTSKGDISTNKVKRKTSDTIPTSTSRKPAATVVSTRTPQTPTTTTSTTAAKMSTITPEENITTTVTATESERASTEQPESSVKIMINGTINCTTEFTSKSVPVNTETDDTENTKADTISGTPNIERMDIESNTFNPNDIITDRNVNGGFDENETFTINVTSSLRTNTSHSTVSPSVQVASKPGVVTDLKHAVNTSKHFNEDYEYDYAEPTLPPSLPNLKIIPFVAADAVVDEKDEISEKDVLTYPVLEREDKFPVYYPKIEKEISFATRREDVYHPTKFPIFTSDKVDSRYPSLTHDDSLSSSGHPTDLRDDLSASVHAHTIAATLDHQVSGSSKSATKLPTTTFDVEEPSVNLFSPPVETEGGFIPKGPGIIDEYFAVYPSTPPGPLIPHLTTSMQLDTDKEDCISSDGRRVADGESISLACSACTCAWGELHCSPRACLTPPMCRRVPAATSSEDVCCGLLVCDHANKTTPVTTTTTTEIPVVISNEKEDSNMLQSEILPTEDPALVYEYANDTAINTGDKPQRSETKDPEINKLKNNETKKEKQPNVIQKIIEEVTISATLLPEENFTTITTTSTTTQEPVNSNHQNIQSQEYEEEEEEDEGFSFGNVLKLLLSENYEATTHLPTKRKSTVPVISESTTKPAPTIPKLITTMKPPSNQPSMIPFSPLPSYRPMYSPQKNIFTPTTVNRIDHLVLGEATAIKRTTIKPATTMQQFVTSSKPVTSTKTIPSNKLLTKPSSQETTTRYDALVPGSLNLMVSEVSRPVPGHLGSGVGLLKLAGCNIYGRMYRVGRIIAELSTPCQECRCTELGVQCAPLTC